MKFKFYFFALLSALFLPISIWADDTQSIVATINGVPIYKSEFEYAYLKNADVNKNEQLTPKQFLNFYIDYKLRVLDALDKDFDKKENFQKEYSKYIADLKRPYIEDSVSNIVWIKEIYDRLKTNIEINDIFIPFPNTEFLYPKDTLETYNLAKTIKQRINKDGSNFEKIAEEYSTSNNAGKSIAIAGHKRWITSLLTNFNYEDAIYKMKINEVSDPIRSQMGYSIVKVLNKRPDRGSIRLSAIQLVFPENATTNQIDSVNSLANKLYNDLVKGANFDSIYMHYSLNPEIETTGDIGFWNVRRPLNKIASDAIKNLKVGDYAPPFTFGSKINILKVTDKQQLPSFDNIKQDIIERLQYNDYINDFNVMENKATQKEIAYNINKTTYDQLLDVSANRSICDSLFIEQITNLNNQEIITIEGKGYNVKDFLMYFSQNKDKFCSIYKLSTDALYFALNSYIYELLTEVKKEQLFDKYPHLKTIADEYYNGLLYFDIMSAEVWDKAQNDRNGIEKVYNQDKEKYNWSEPRYEGYLLFVKNDELKQKAKNIIENNKDNFSTILKDSLNKNKEINILIDKGFWAKGENQYIDELLFNLPASKTMIGYSIYFFEGEKIEQPRSVDDVRGFVVADYQQILEKEWIKNLRKRADIKINNNVLNSISVK